MEYDMLLRLNGQVDLILWGFKAQTIYFKIALVGFFGGFFSF